MRFFTTFLVSAFVAMASAQNMFTMATLPSSIPAGSTFNITWQPTTQGSVSLLLVQASSSGSTLVHTVSTIAANITNSGAFAWIPSNLTPKGSGYAIEIVDDSNPNVTNYSGQFAIDSTAGPSSSAASVSGTTGSATAASSTTGSASSTGSTSATTGSMSTTTTTTGSMSSSSGSVTSSPTSASTTLSTVTSSSASSSAPSSSGSATATAKNAGVGVETGRSGLGLLAALGVAVLFL